EPQQAVVAKLRRGEALGSQPGEQSLLAVGPQLVGRARPTAMRVVAAGDESLLLEPRELGVDLGERSWEEDPRREVRGLLDRVAGPGPQPQHAEHEIGGRSKLHPAAAGSPGPVPRDRLRSLAQSVWMYPECHILRQVGS